MFRTAVSYIVMLGFVAGQLAALPHAHAESATPADHNDRLHIHSSCLDDVGHCHDGGHSHHHDADDNASHPSRPEASTEHSGHDSNAVYLPNDLGISLPAKNVGPVVSVQLITPLGTVVEPATPCSIDYAEAAFFPDKCSPARPLYLVLRALRI